MTELEKIQRAKTYIDKLANGINPIDDVPVSDDNIINNVRLSRCFFFVSDVLRQIIENGGIGENTPEEKTLPSSLTDNQEKLFTPSDIPVTISEMAKVLKGMTDVEKGMKITSSRIAEWLVDIGALEIKVGAGGKFVKCPTARGNEMGIETESRVGRFGEYQAIVCNRAAQQLIADNIDAIMYIYEAAENQFHRWDSIQDNRLTELFMNKVPVSEIANTLSRTERGVRARLRRLGLIEK